VADFSGKTLEQIDVIVRVNNEMRNCIVVVASSRLGKDFSNYTYAELYLTISG